MDAVLPDIEIARQIAKVAVKSAFEGRPAGDFDAIDLEKIVRAACLQAIRVRREHPRSILHASKPGGKADIEAAMFGRWWRARRYPATYPHGGWGSSESTQELAVQLLRERILAEEKERA